MCTQVSSCVGVIVWMALDYHHTGFVGLSGMISGALAGLAGVTPASGFIHVKSSVVIGIITTTCSYFVSVWLKEKLRLDDVLDVTSLQVCVPLHCCLLILTQNPNRLFAGCSRSYW